MPQKDRDPQSWILLSYLHYGVLFVCYWKQVLRRHSLDTMFASTNLTHVVLSLLAKAWSWSLLALTLV